MGFASSQPVPTPTLLLQPTSFERFSTAIRIHVSNILYLYTMPATIARASPLEPRRPPVFTFFPSRAATSPRMLSRGHSLAPNSLSGSRASILFCFKPLRTLYIHGAPQPIYIQPLPHSFPSHGGWATPSLSALSFQPLPHSSNLITHASFASFLRYLVASLPHCLFRCRSTLFSSLRW